MEAVFPWSGTSVEPTWHLMKDLDVNLAIWKIFVNATLQAAVHLGKDHDANLRCVEDHLWKTAGQLFRETEKLVSGRQKPLA